MMLFHWVWVATRSTFVIDNIDWYFIHGKNIWTLKSTIDNVANVTLDYWTQTNAKHYWNWNMYTRMIFLVFVVCLTKKKKRQTKSKRSWIRQANEVIHFSVVSFVYSNGGFPHEWNETLEIEMEYLCTLCIHREDRYEFGPSNGFWSSSLSLNWFVEHD